MNVTNTLALTVLLSRLASNPPSAAMTAKVIGNAVTTAGRDERR
jgi:hypothetical protein